MLARLAMRPRNGAILRHFKNWVAIFHKSIIT